MSTNTDQVNAFMTFLTLSPDHPFSLDRTLGCGQVFRWDRDESGWWYGIVSDRAIRIRQDASRLSFEGAPAKFIRHYFSLDQDLTSILDAIDQDPIIHASIGMSRGLRLVRQPAWECLISYICSTNSNIPHIRKRIAAIAKMSGKEITFKGRTFHVFPDPSAISGSGPDILAGCKLGYREPYVSRTSGTVLNVKQWEERISSLPYEEARRQLMTLPGIGPKAADCVLLFAFQRYEAFPVDVWIRRIMQQHYLPSLNSSAPLTNKEYDRIRGFAKSHFGGYCGYAQEYLYASREG